MSIVKELGDAIGNFTPQMARDLRLHLEEKFGIEAPGGTVVEAPPPTVEVKAEPTEFNVIYKGFDATKKMGVIKVFRDALGLGLIEAKNATEGGPRTIKESVDKASAEEVLKKFTEAGAVAVIEPA